MDLKSTKINIWNDLTCSCSSSELPLSTVRCSYLAWRSEPHNRSFSVVRYGHGGDLWNFWLWGSERNLSCGCETAASGAQKRRDPTVKHLYRAPMQWPLAPILYIVVLRDIYSSPERGQSHRGRRSGGLTQAGRKSEGGTAAVHAEAAAPFVNLHNASAYATLPTRACCLYKYN
jgi:hypothetical protein